jgi:hypothetical protein
MTDITPPPELTEQMMLATLSCWTCYQTVNIEVMGPPMFAFELVGWAKDVGWIGSIDMQRSRSLVFCSQECQCKALTKTGRFRARRPSKPQHSDDRTEQGDA